MKKNNLLFLASLVFASQGAQATETLKELKIETKVGEPFLVFVPTIYSYGAYALQAAGAAYAISAIKNLISTEIPTDKDATSKRVLEARIEKAKQETKVWAGMSLVLVGFLGKMAMEAFLPTIGMQGKLAVTTTKEVTSTK